MNTIEKSKQNINYFDFIIVTIIGIVIYLRFLTDIIMSPDSLIERETLFHREYLSWAVSMGRYGLKLLGAITSYEISPMFYTLLSIILMACIIYIIHCIFFKNGNIFSLIILSLILFSSNTFSQILTYNNQSFFYMISYLFAVLAAYIMIYYQDFVHYIIAILLITISLTIYQTFILSTITILFFYIISDLLHNNFELKKYKNWLIIGLLSCFLYFLSMICIRLINSNISFENVNNKFVIGNIFISIYKCYVDFFKYYFTNDIVNNIFLRRGILNIVLFLLSIFLFIYYIKINGLSLNKKIILIISCCLIPIVIFMCEIVFPNRSIHGDTGNLIMPCTSYMYIFFLYIFSSFLNDRFYILRFLLCYLCFVSLFFCYIFQDCMFNNRDVVKNAVNQMYIDLSNIEDVKNKKIILYGKFDYGNKEHYDIVKGTIATYGIAWKTNLYHPCINSFIKYYNNLNINFAGYEESKQQIDENVTALDKISSFPCSPYYYLKDDYLFIKIGEKR